MGKREIQNLTTVGPGGEEKGGGLGELGWTSTAVCETREHREAIASLPKETLVFTCSFTDVRVQQHFLRSVDQCLMMILESSPGFMYRLGVVFLNILC